MKSDIITSGIKKFLQVIYTLLTHQWKSFWRSRDAGKNLGVQIFIGFITLYLLACAIGIGFFLRGLLVKAFPGQDIVKIFCGFILYYFLLDMLIRFMVQSLPTLTIQPYLVQNIRRRQLIRFLNVRSMVNVINIIPLLLSVPFTVVVIAPQYGGLTAFAFIISIFTFALFDHFSILYVKRKSIINSWWFVIFFVVIGSFAAADYFHVFSLRNASSFIFTRMLIHPLMGILPLCLAILAFINNYRFLFKNLYLEDITAKNKRKEGTEYAFLNRFGTVGELIGIDIKLILRNKRPRSVVLLTVFFLFYGFLFYKQQYIHDSRWGFLIGYAIFIIGAFIINYGQSLFAWQSAHFDGMMAGKMGIRTYIKSKFVLFTAVCTVVLLLTSFYGFMSWKLLVLQVAAYLYNIGIQTVIVVYFATRSYKAIDIGRAASFNYQGMGADRWVYAAAILFIPSFIYGLFALIIHFWAGVSWTGVSWAGVIVLSALGLISFLLQDWWINILTAEFFKRKYKILDGFREK